MIHTAYNTIHDTACSAIEALPSQETVSTAIGKAFHDLKEGVSSTATFLYNVFFVDLQDMEISQAAEYRTYKAVSARILGVALLMLGIALFYSSIASPFNPVKDSILWVLAKAEVGAFTAVGGLSILGLLFGSEISEYDQALAGYNQQEKTFATLRDFVKRDTLEKEAKALEDQCNAYKESLEDLQAKMKAAREYVLALQSPALLTNDDFSVRHQSAKQYTQALAHHNSLQQEYTLTSQKHQKATQELLEKRFKLTQ